MKYANTMADLIGNTPLVKLQKINSEANLFAKCEFMNPISIKDRPVLQIINHAEATGALKPGDTLIEMTSGNTGMAIAYIAAVRGYKAVLVMSEIQSVERRKIMKAFGAELILTPAALGTAGAKAKLQTILAEHPKYFYVGQHKSPENPNSHYLTTGPELWQDMDGHIDLLVAGLGTGGTLCGAGKYLKEKEPNIQLIAVEPFDAPYISQGIFKPHRIMGTAPGFYPDTLDREIIDEILLIKEEDAFEMCRQLAAREGMLVGISSGAVAHIMVELATRTENKGKNIVGIFADSGQRYLSVEGLFNV
jgi:cysteine synthase A